MWPSTGERWFVLTLSEDLIAELLEPYLMGARETVGDGVVKPEFCTQSAPEALYPKLRVYLELLLRWNARTNLTAIREPREIVQRHFGESLFAGSFLASRLAEGAALLDFGSGAGFPGIPIQLLLPGVRVTLAESQGKKAAFLREAVRALELKSTVWRKRVEMMPSEVSFAAVTMRAVDGGEAAVAKAWERVSKGGLLVRMTAGHHGGGTEDVRMPGLSAGYLQLDRKL